MTCSRNLSPYFCQVANDLLRADAMNADAIYVRGLCLYYEDNVDKAFTHFQQVKAKLHKWT